MATYYVAPITTAGLGTLANPWGIPDLLVAGSPYTQGVALTTLQPGDTLYFRGGTYSIGGYPTPSQSTQYTNYPLLNPTHSGTAGNSITLQAYPGESVIINDPVISPDGYGAQPVFGCLTPTVHYIRFIGFTINCGSAPAFYLVNGTHCEVGYCKVIGVDLGNSFTDNHDGIRVQSADSTWIHHCEISNVKAGTQHNSAGLKVYSTTNLLFEDNYVHDNVVGAFDKDATASVNNDVYRRNWLTNNSYNQFLGINNPGTATYQIYDNVIDGGIHCVVGHPVTSPLTTNNQIYNNLIRTSESNASVGATGLVSLNNDGGASTLDNVWNNITIGGGGTIQAYRNSAATFAAGVQLNYMDYNFYDGASIYDFAYYSLPQVTYSLAQFQALGLETHSAQDAVANIFVDQAEYVLQSAYQTAGRYGDKVGPRYAVARILDTGRYGPNAITAGGSGSPPYSEPPGSLIEGPTKQVATGVAYFF